VTVDERLEALTHSVEVLAQMQIKTEEHLKALETDQRQTHKEIRRFVRFARAILPPS
jgi:septation ring formation regulator EzrA